MRVVVVYKPLSEHRMAVETFMADVKRQSGHDLETLNPETREGDSFCKLYDIIEYPSIVVLAGDGIMQDMWRGLPLPTVNEVIMYVQTN